MSSSRHPNDGDKNDEVFGKGKEPEDINEGQTNPSQEEDLQRADVSSSENFIISTFAAFLAEAIPPATPANSPLTPSKRGSKRPFASINNDFSFLGNLSTSSTSSSSSSSFLFTPVSPSGGASNSSQVQEAPLVAPGAPKKIRKERIINMLPNQLFFPHVIAEDQFVAAPMAPINVDDAGDDFGLQGVEVADVDSDADDMINGAPINVDEASNDFGPDVEQSDAGSDSDADMNDANFILPDEQKPVASPIRSPR